jgi:Anthrone oxygenase
MPVAQFINMFLYALVAGVFWGTWFSLSRSIPSITPATFLEIGRIMIDNLGGPMSLLMPAASLMNLAVCIVMFRRRQSKPLIFACAALLLLLVALTLTLTVNVPIDNQIKRWTLTTLPVDWESTRNRWEFAHSMRTFASLIGLGCAFASALSARTSSTWSL